MSSNIGIQSTLNGAALFNLGSVPVSFPGKDGKPIVVTPGNNEILQPIGTFNVTAVSNTVATIAYTGGIPGNPGFLSVNGNAFTPDGVKFEVRITLA